VSTLGGIDQILAHYLKATATNELPGEMLLSSDQLQDIDRIVSQQDEINKMATLSLDLTMRGQHRDLTIHFETSNTYLNRLFGRELATQIINRFLFQRYWLYLMLVISNFGFLAIIHSITKSHDHLIIYPTFGIWTLLCPWLLLLFLSTNTKSMAMISRTFDFWIKLINVAIYAIVKVIYIHMLSEDLEESRKTNAWLVYDSFYAVFQILVVLTWSSLDALQFRQNIMLFFGVILSASFTLNAVYITVWTSSHDEDDDDSMVYFGDYSFSLLSIMDHALRVVAIFLWKQTITSIVNRKHNRCIIIKYSPWIEWIDSTPPSGNKVQRCDTMAQITQLDNAHVDKSDNDGTDAGTAGKEGPMDRVITEREVVVTQQTIVTVQDDEIDAVVNDVNGTDHELSVDRSVQL